MARPALMVSTAASGRLELFLVAGVATVLVIRTFLLLTGFPQLGGDGLHIAHLLWGGLGMSLALMLAVSALGRRAFTAVALIGGVGFGFFIDEIGKFVTADNDYFFRPAVALIYIAFVALALVARVLSTRPLQPDAALANALDLIGSARLEGVDRETRDQILDLLERAGLDRDVVRALRASVEAMPVVPADRGRLERARTRVAAAYAGFAGTALFRRLAVAYGLLYLVCNLPLLIPGAREWLEGTAASAAPEGWAAEPPALIGIALTAVGTVQLVRGRRASGFRWLRYATVFSMLITQPLAFLNEEFAALPGFALLLLAYVALGYAEQLEARSGTPRHRPPAPAATGR